MGKCETSLMCTRLHSSHQRNLSDFTEQMVKVSGPSTLLCGCRKEKWNRKLVFPQERQRRSALRVHISRQNCAGSITDCSKDTVSYSSVVASTFNYPVNIHRHLCVLGSPLQAPFLEKRVFLSSVTEQLMCEGTSGIPQLQIPDQSRDIWGLLYCRSSLLCYGQFGVKQDLLVLFSKLRSSQSAPSLYLGWGYSSTGAGVGISL